MEIATQPLVYEGQIIAQIGHYKQEIPSVLPVDVPPVPPDIVNN